MLQMSRKKKPSCQHNHHSSSEFFTSCSLHQHHHLHHQQQHNHCHPHYHPQHHQHANCSSNHLFTVNPVITRKISKTTNQPFQSTPTISSHNHHFNVSLISLTSTIFWILSILFCLLSLHCPTSLAITITRPNYGDQYVDPINSPICRQDRSLCSSVKESELHALSGLKLNSITGDPMRKVANELNDYNHKFDDIVKDLLKQSEQSFHSMFTRTYGLLYEKHSSLFSEMYTVLGDYYGTNNLNLDAEFHHFFTNLYKKMFQELNSHYSLNEDYLKCIAGQMDVLNPFGDIPKKLVIEVQRSFTAARVFSQSLVTVSDIIKQVGEHTLTPNCHRYFTQMNYCQQCADQSSDRLPCRGYCLNVMSICTQSYRSLNKEWNPLLDKLAAIINRLETSFNIESVVGPLNIKISEAIMNFQENGASVTQKLLVTCGRPSRGKRRAIFRRPPTPSDPSSASSSSSSSSSMDNGGSSGKIVKSPMEYFLDDTKNQLRKFRDFWIRLPETICNSSIVPGEIQTSNNNKPCWNQTDAQVNPMIERGEPLLEKIDFINSQRVLLRNINSKLDAAYKGSDIPEDEDLSGGGSGSGDGDYDDYPDYNENDDDDDDGDNPDEETPKSSTPPSSPSSSSVSPSSSSTVDPFSSTAKSSVSHNDNNPNNDKQSSTTGPSSTNVDANGQDNQQQQSPAHPQSSSKDSSCLVDKSSLLIVTLAILSMYASRTGRTL